MMTRREIAQNVFLTEVEGGYKRSRLSVYMASPLARDNLTATAMLPFVLERGTARFPDMTLLKRRQNVLYGAGLSLGYSINGFARVIEGHIEGVDGSLVPGEDIPLERTGLLLEALFDPHVADGAFPDAGVDIEREKLREVIRSIINDKREYCARLLLEAFFALDERALPRDGFEEDLGGIDGAALFKAYGDIVSRSSLEIVYVGTRLGALEEKLLEALERCAPERRPAAIKAVTAVPKGGEQAVARAMEVEQDKLALAFTPGRVLDRRELTALRMASALLGGTPTSRLFMNVREKQSLCYSILSQPSYLAGGGLIIECGVGHADSGRAREAILAELAALAQKGPSEKELAEAKLFFGNILRGVLDNSAALGGYVYSAISRFGEAVAPAQELEMLERVTAAEVMERLGEMNLNASCLLHSA
jgi:predicted Zn-dependent peptidase